MVLYTKMQISQRIRYFCGLEKQRIKHPIGIYQVPTLC